MDLQRFLDAQNSKPSAFTKKTFFELALIEIGRNGEKESHYQWFMFPQIRGLGNSAMAKKYALRDVFEAG